MRTLVRRLLVAGAVVGACAVLAARPGPAFAHERSTSFATLVPDRDGVDIELRLSARDLTRLPQSAKTGATGDTTAAQALAAGLRVRRAGARCAPLAPPRVSTPATGRSLLQWRVSCPSAGELEVESVLPQVLGTPHLCFVRVVGPGGRTSEVLLHSEKPRWGQSPQGAVDPPASSPEFLWLGVAHIAGGVDHLLFVLGLLLVSVALGEVVVVITAFTVAHTLTLGAAVLGLLQPATPAVEALIAASIALLGVENLTLRCGRSTHVVGKAPMAAAAVLAPALLAAFFGVGNVAPSAVLGTTVFSVCYLAMAARYPQERRLRWLVAFVFGLLHGFGFAGALGESGFSKASLPTMLLAFNGGVELGQLLFVAALWPLLLLLRRRFTAAYGRLVVEPASAILLASGVAWYGLRAFG